MSMKNVWLLIPVFFGKLDFCWKLVWNWFLVLLAFAKI